MRLSAPARGQRYTGGAPFGNREMRAGGGIFPASGIPGLGIGGTGATLAAMNGDAPIIDLHSDERFMALALREAGRALAAEEVPVGAVVVHQGRIIARAWNQVEILRDATAHAEMLALTAAQQALGDWRLTGCTVFVTKEPCPMCAGAIVHCRPDRLVFGCADARGGAAGSWINLLDANPPLNHRCEVTAGVLAAPCAAMIRDFFRAARAKKKAAGIDGPVGSGG